MPYEESRGKLGENDRIIRLLENLRRNILPNAECRVSLEEIERSLEAVNALLSNKTLPPDIKNALGVFSKNAATTFDYLKISHKIGIDNCAYEKLARMIKVVEMDASHLGNVARGMKLDGNFGSLAFQVERLCEHIASMNKGQGQASILSCFDAFLGGNPEQKLTAENVYSAKEKLVSLIESRYSEKYDKMEAFLGSIRDFLGKRYPLDNYDTQKFSRSSVINPIINPVTCAYGLLGQAIAQAEPKIEQSKSI